MKDEINTKSNAIWSCSDFYSAVILRTSGIPLIGLNKTLGKYVVFVFGASQEKCESILKSHWDRTLQLETRLFIETINELKTRVHEKVKENV